MEGGDFEESFVNLRRIKEKEYVLREEATGDFGVA